MTPMNANQTGSEAAGWDRVRTGGGRRAAGWAVLVVGVGLAVGWRSAEERPEAGASAGGLPLGSIVAFGGPATAVPETQGWMLCDGRELPVSTFQGLAAVLAGAWGQSTNGATFRLPDLRGRFLRGVNYEAPAEYRDPDRLQRLASAPGGSAGNEVGSVQEDGVGPHPHPLVGAGNAVGVGTDNGWVRLYATKLPDDAAGLVTSETSVQPGSGSETRPRNVYVNWIIRVR